MSAQAYIQRVKQIRLLIGFQTSLRLLLRALWLGLGVATAAWAIYRLTGWLSQPLFWAGLGVAAAVAPLYRMVFSWPKAHQMVWALDRIYQHKQQISTAYQCAQQAQHSALEQELIDDAGVLLARLQAHFLRRGWVVARDGLALVIVLALLAGAYLDSSSQFDLAMANQSDIVEEAALPPAYVEPQKTELDAEQSAKDAPVASQTQVNAGSISAEDLQALVKAAQKMGAKLAEISETQQAGEALQALDLAKAAEALQQLAKSEEAPSNYDQQKIGAALQAGKDALSETSLSEVSEDIEAAQKALETNDWNGAKEGIQQLVDDLTQINTQLTSNQAGEQSATADGQAPSGQGDNGAGSGSDARQQGSPEDFSRLTEAGSELDLSSSTESPDMPGSLKPGEAIGEGTQTASGSYSSAGPAGFSPNQGVIVPIYYGWSWKNAVSRYFQPIQ